MVQQILHRQQRLADGGLEQPGVSAWRPRDGGFRGFPAVLGNAR